MSTFGKYIEVSLFGESHGEAIGVTIHNLPSGVKIDLDKIRKNLIYRKGIRALSTQRQEADDFKIVSGYFNGYTTGSPLTVIIYNENTKSKDYDKIKDLPRPSHADYTSNVKYDGFNDYRGGGHFSGRITTSLVILGCICEDCLKSKFDIFASTRVKTIYNITDNSEFVSPIDDIFPVINENVKEEMYKLIEECKKNKNSVGGVLETKVFNCPMSLGNPFFDSVESVISHLMFSVGGVKGIEFGSGFDLSKMYGSEANDQMIYEDGKVKYLSNHSGGINGGISNGNDIIFRVSVKPTPSIYLPQKTFSMTNLTNETLEIEGRHDPVIAIRAAHVINALTYYAILELLIGARLWK